MWNPVSSPLAPGRWQRGLLASVVGCCLLIAAQLGGCARNRIIVPPLTPSPTGTQQVGKFVWFDLLTNDVAAVKRFYGELFGWNYETGDGGTYTVIKLQGTMIGGMVHVEDLNEQVDRSRWLSWISVEDVDGAVERVRRSGGRVHAGPLDLRERGRAAVISDPQGAVVAFVRSDGGDPIDREPTTGDWLWTELWTSDLERAVAFYEELAGYDKREVDAYEGTDYYVLERHHEARAGAGRIRSEGVLPHWLPYVAVDDLEATLEKTVALGGTVIIRPEDVRGGTVAVIADPSGAALSVQVWPLDEEDRVE